MARTKRWKELGVEDGCGTWVLSSWKYFYDFVYQEMLDFGGYAWRGQRCDDWNLEPTLDRLLRLAKRTRVKNVRRDHLQRFIYAARGRRGTTPPAIESDNDWWALGQHHGLATPLLDWTMSPFAAAYFAFIGEGVNQTPRRAIYALVGSVDEKAKEITKAHKGDARPAILEYVRPLSDENPRLVNQSGLFTRAPDGMDVETWVRKHYKGEDEDYVLMKVTIPNKDRALALRSLNRMNVNHLTAFPDLYGASRFCNVELEIRDY